ncbi:MAG: hypothetical protein ABIR36_12765 [Nitrospiraceae bacterium]
MDRRQALEAYVELFHQAIRHRVPENEFSVLLSGGRYSRHILLELLRNDACPSFCFTLDLPGRRDGSDAVVAAKVAQAVNVPHHHPSY